MMTYEEVQKALEAFYQTHSHRFSCWTVSYSQSVLKFLKESPVPLYSGDIAGMLCKSVSVAQHALLVLETAGVIRTGRVSKQNRKTYYFVNDVSDAYVDDVIKYVGMLVDRKLSESATREEEADESPVGRAEKIVNSARLHAPTSIFDLRVQNFPISCQQTL